MIGNCAFFHAAGDWRYADVGELVFGPTHYGRMLAKKDQGVKRAAICMQEIGMAVWLGSEGDRLRGKGQSLCSSRGHLTAAG